MMYADNIVSSVADTECADKRRSLADIMRENAEKTDNLNERADRLLRFLVGKDTALVEQKNVGCMLEDAEKISADLSRLSEKLLAIEDILGV